LNRSNEYQRQEILSASPLQLVVKLYDVAIASCFQNDRIKLRKALVELISSLNLEDGGDFTSRMYRLYEFCMDQSVSGDLDDIREILIELREAWKQADLKSAA
jgi:flagellar protein FliS